jgi:MoaA/NifB/PqqE/SkfB family radical SAM enzyme
MKTLQVNGVREKIPAYPHAKNYVFRCARFFDCRGVLPYMAQSNFKVVRDLFRGVYNRCVIPRNILVDPTNACNMHCLGCWAGDYENAESLSYERWDELLREAKALGIRDILYTGGEPLTRKRELLALAEKHNGLFFGVYTNAALVDREFADEMERLGNIMLFISIEGYKEETDFRRGKGAYENIIKTMRLLKDRGLAYGFSLCYHKQNFRLLTSDEYLNFLREQGAWMGWAFGYRPIGRDADLSLALNAEERLFVYRRFQDYGSRHSFPIIDLFNSGHKAFGCVGGGDGYLHINAAGDVEPCAFCHYSDANINDMTLKQALQSPFLRAFRREKPFSPNPFGPCPVYDVPQAMVNLCRETGACSTHAVCPESAEENAEKLSGISAEWNELTGDKKLWNSREEQKRHGGLQKSFRIMHRLVGDYRVRSPRNQVR